MLTKLGGTEILSSQSFPNTKLFLLIINKFIYFLQSVGKTVLWRKGYFGYHQADIN